MPVLATPFDRDGEIDPVSLRAEIDWIFGHGADGVVIGMVSDVLRLSSEERDSLVGLVVDITAGRGPVVASVGAESTHLARRFVRNAAARGAAAVMATPPVAIRIPPSETLAYFEDLAAASSLPVVVQDASSYVGAPMSVELMATLAQRLGSGVFFKPEAQPVGPTITSLREATNGQARVLDGSGGIALVDAFRRGAVGTMPGPDICWALVALWEALVSHDDERIYGINGPLSALISLQTSLDSFIAIQKYLLVRQGVFEHAAARGPVGYCMDRETRDEVDRMVTQLATAVGLKSDEFLKATAP